MKYGNTKFEGPILKKFEIFPHLSVDMPYLNIPISLKELKYD